MFIERFNILNIKSFHLFVDLLDKTAEYLAGTYLNKVSTPSSIIFLIESSNSTELLTCLIRRSFTLSLSIIYSAVTFVTTGICMSPRVTLSSSAASLSPAGFSMLQWNGALTARSIALFAPSLLQFPKLLHCLYLSCNSYLARAVKVRRLHNSFRRSLFAAFFYRLTVKPYIAAMVPTPTGTASCMNLPLFLTNATASLKVIVPAATWAEYSPRLSPATTSGFIPSPKQAGAKPRWLSKWRAEYSRLS